MSSSIGQNPTFSCTTCDGNIVMEDGNLDAKSLDQRQ